MEHNLLIELLVQKLRKNASLQQSFYSIFPNQLFILLTSSLKSVVFEIFICWPNLKAIQSQLVLLPRTYKQL